MTRAIWLTVTVLALFVGISGCFPYRDWRWNGNGHGYANRASRDEDKNGNRWNGSNCYRQGSDTVCRRSGD